MKDKISEDRINLLHPKVREDFRNFINDAEEGLGITLRVVQGFRTLAEQQAIYDQGRTKPGKIVTKSKPGASYHNYGLAIDVAQLKDGQIIWDFSYFKLQPFADKYGIKWGGSFHSFPDKPHFEKTFGYHWTALLDKQKAHKFIAGTEYVDI